MSGTNSKASKTDRLLSRQSDDSRTLRRIEFDIAKIRRVMIGGLDRQREMHAENIALRLERDTLAQQLRSANAFLAKPLQRVAPFREVPTLRVADIVNTAPAPSNAHVYDEPRRCSRCGYLKAAIEASDLPCVESLGEIYGT
jgi:hypothetical protein